MYGKHKKNTRTLCLTPYFATLTVLVLDGVVIARLGSLRGATLVDGTDAELVHDLFLQTVHLTHAVVVLRLRTLGPVGEELVLALDDVVRDRTTTILLGLLPLQLHKVYAVVVDSRLTRCLGRICFFNTR